MQNQDLDSDIIKYLVSSYYDVQGGRIRLNNRLSALTRNQRLSDTGKERLESITENNFVTMERNIEKNIKKEVKKYPLWKDWLKDVRGIGELFGGVLITQLVLRRQMQYKTTDNSGYFWYTHPDDFNETNREEQLAKIQGEPTGEERHGFACFDHPGKLIAYAGLHCIDGKAAKRQRGAPSNWNTFLKTKLLLMGESFIKSGLHYRIIYDHFRAKAEKDYPKSSKAHWMAMGKRHTTKVFLNHIWTVGRLQQDLSVEPHYSLKYPDKLPEHVSKHYIPPLRDKGEFPQQWCDTWSQWGEEYPYWIKENVAEKLAKKNK